MIEQNYLYIWIQHTQIIKKKPIPILASDQKFIYVDQCNGSDKNFYICKTKSIEKTKLCVCIILQCIRLK